MLLLSTFIQDSQSLCVYWVKHKMKGLLWSETAWAPNHAEGCGWGLEPRNGVLSAKPHSLPTSLTNTPAGRRRVRKWEWSFSVLHLWVLLPYFLNQKSRCMTNTVVLMATKEQDFIFHPYPSTCLLILDRGEGREREKDVREKHWSVGSGMPLTGGPNLQPGLVPWLGMEPLTFWFMGWCSDQQCHISLGKDRIFLKHSENIYSM